MFNQFQNMNMKQFFSLVHKIFNWEYWPQWLVYAPITPVYLYYTIKCRTPFFMVAANPGVENGGYLLESKYKLHQQLPKQLVPETVFIKQEELFKNVLKLFRESGIRYPFYCKPDIGGRGRGVLKIENEQELKQYHFNTAGNYLLQQAIPYKNEIGVFYCRIPGKQYGFISGITGKQYMEVTGDGVKCLQELIEEEPRYYFQRQFLFEKFNNRLMNVLPKGEVMQLSEIGNHARGSAFTDVTGFKNEKLERLFDKISEAVSGFYYGRYDVKFNSWEELYEGKNFMIIELNGSGSEPTHIYDPAKKIWQAWKIILQHWKIMYRISVANHKNGVAYLSVKEGRALQKMESAIARAFNQKEKLKNEIRLKSATPLRLMNEQMLVS